MQSQDKERAEEPTENGFLAELRSQYERDLDFKNSLDNKISNMFTMAGSIITISLTIATFLISKITDQWFTFISLIILGFGIVFAVLSILSLFKAYSLKTCRIALGHKEFFDKTNDTIYKENIAKRFMNASKREFGEHMAMEYLESIKTNVKTNQAKADNIKKGQKYLVCSIITVSILVSFVIVVITTGVSAGDIYSMVLKFIFPKF